MTIYNPQPLPPGPLYQAIVQAMSRDFQAGVLRPFDRMPTHRELADVLGVTVGTVTRAYKLAQRRGLIRGEVGRGTYVTGSGPDSLPQHESWTESAEKLDLRLNLPPYDQDPDLAPVLESLSRRGDLAELLKYQPSAGMPRHRAAGAAWVRMCGLVASPEEIVVCNGAQHAILIALSALVRPGDTIMTEALTYPGVKTLAGIMGLRLEPVAMDEEGLIPEALDAACRRRKARGLYCMPTLHNPTTGTLSEARRREIAKVAAEHDLFIIEDDIYRLLLPEAPPPLAAFAPERTFYIPGVSKTLAGGLRIAYIAAPPKYLEALTRGIAATTWLSPPLTAEIATIWIEDGTALQTLERKRSEAAGRWEIAARILGSRLTRSAPNAYHLWLELPPSWRSSQFADESNRAGVSVLPSELFTVGHAQAPQAVRVSLTAARTRHDLARALSRLAELLDRPPEPTPFIL